MTEKNYWETERFLKLRRRWYKKLEREGFKDLETIDWTTGESTGFTGSSCKVARAFAGKPDRAEYYRLAAQLTESLPEHGFSRRDCAIWEAHASGTTYVTIARKFRVHASTIRRRCAKIRRLLNGV